MLASERMPGRDLSDQEPAVYVQRGGIVRNGSGVQHAEALASDVSTGLPKFEGSLSGYDLP